jgi:tRNA (guanine-N7-)-methyltransferase
MSNAPRPGESPASLIYQLPSITERLDLAKLFPKRQPLEVELGSGDATFLAEYAARNPERNFIGVERLLGRMRKLDRKGHRAALTNLRGVRIECGYFLEWLLPLHSVSALHVYFPDPWPKKKHQRHRLINVRFPALARQALAPDGMVCLRTDDADYFGQMAEVFAAAPGFRKIETPPELAALLTDFEKDFRARGVETLRAAYVCVEPLNRSIGSNTAGRPIQRFNEPQTSITGPSPSLRGGDFCW